MNTYIKLDNNWFKGECYIKNVDKLSFAVYILLQERSGYGNRCYFNINYLITHLNMKSKTKYYDPLKKSLKSLREVGLIKFHINIHDENELDVDIDGIGRNEELYVSIKEPVSTDFTCIYASEIFAILFSDHGTYNTRAGILAQFCFIISCINQKDKVCYPSFRTIKQKSCISSIQTCKNNLDILVDLDLLVIGNPYVMINGQCGVSQTANIYGRLADKESVDKMVKEKVLRINRKPMSKHTRDLSNKKRSLMQSIKLIERKQQAGTLTDEDIRIHEELQEEYNQLCVSSNKSPKLNYTTQEVVVPLEDVNELEISSGVMRYTKDVDLDEDFVF